MKVGGVFMKVSESSETLYRLYFLLLSPKGGLLCPTFLNFVFSRFRLVLGYRDLNTYFPPQTPKIPSYLGVIMVIPLIIIRLRIEALFSVSELCHVPL